MTYIAIVLTIHTLIGLYNTLAAIVARARYERENKEFVRNMDLWGEKLEKAIKEDEK